MSRKGCDFAKWIPIKDYDKVRRAGVEFAILKVINGSNQPDSRFYEHVSGLNSAGVPIIGGYIFLCQHRGKGAESR